MKLTLLIPGQPEPAASFGAAARGVPAAPGASPATKLLDGVRVTHAFSLSQMARDKTPHPHAIEVEDDDILEIELDDGFTLWTSVARYREQLLSFQPDAVTAEGVHFSVLPRPSIESRDVKKWLSRAVRFLRLEPDEITRKVAAEFGERLATWAATKLLMKLIESQLTPGAGLYQWGESEAGGPQPFEQAKRVEQIGPTGGRPILVFIHGTASSTLGSFGAFAAPEARPQWRRIREYFGDHIYAFEHRTLSQSPIENALELAKRLPKNAKLHLVSHSRGGMVGDLLCLPAITDAQLARFKRRDPDLADADRADAEDLKRLGELLADKQFEIVRFVRVACPARGTLLASENLDNFLSILAHLIGLIPALGASPIYHVIKRVTLEVAKNRCRPELIPGLEAMIPTSPLVALLNTVDRPVKADLAVVAGDIEGGGWLKRIGVFITDTFIYERRDNDLVVNTDSMFHGVRREAGGRYLFDQGSDVSHFNYFRNERTRSAVQRWLTAPTGDTPADFRPIEADGFEPVPMLRSIQKRSGAPQPVVFVLPGIMGSHLSVGGERVWLNYLRLVSGGIGRLRNIADPEIQATHLLGDSYRAICTHLSDTHEAIPFAYDWRKSIASAADALAREVESKLAATQQPVRFVAHSMGGLVVRAMIQRKPELWEQLCKRPGGRFVMLGTPNRGSHAIVETLLGVATIVKQLALLDFAYDRQEIVDIVSGFPGALELLPNDGDRFFSRGTWTEFKDAGACGATPSVELLAGAKNVLQSLADEIPHADRVHYVAGSAPVTPCDVEIKNGKVVLKATSDGDGRVTYASGKLPDVKTWYVDAEHGELADVESAFPAIVELLETGTTSRLATSPPRAARGEAAVFQYVSDPVLYPAEADLAAGALGRRPKRPVKQKPGALRLSVVHGDLGYARFPVMLGHYEGDTIAAAEAHLDRRLDGILSARYQLGLYPGPVGSVTVKLSEQTALQKELGRPRGAIVVGLGKMGELNAGMLADVVRKGSLAYILRLAESASKAQSAADAPAPIAPGEAGLSILLIGCNSASNVTVEDSLGAIVRGVARANSELAQALPDRLRIGEIEIIEVFADAAIQAAHAANELAEGLSKELQIRLEPDPLLRQRRKRRRRLRQNPHRDYWRRVIITWKQDDQEGALRFLALSERARAEVIVQHRQPELIEQLVRSSILDTRFQPDSAKTLFELLVPNELKDGLTQLSWLVLVVDAETANYPWELMVDSSEPVSAKVGMVRQLETAQYRTQVRATTVKSAYVVGDPLTSKDLPALPGAREEASLVADLLGDYGYDVTYNPQRATAMEVLNQLFARPYRILHLAGHGYYEAATGSTRAARSGMVLEGGVFLTAVEVGQMREVPDLVFLNCCHLAQVGPESPAPSNPVAYNKLAASISRELIEMGVRAVVAAGWAVRDDAAKAFAKTFYEEMFAGETFGRALLHARRKTFQEFQNCNTWGAYQAYGDPDFKLDPRVRPGTTDEPTRFVAPDELVVELTVVRERATDCKRAGTQDADQDAGPRQVDDLVKRCPPEWLQRGDVLVEIGLAYGEFKEFKKAVEYLERATAAENDSGSVPLEAVEQLANFEARLGEKEKSPALIDRAVKRLEALLKLGETAERWNLHASACKRLAQVSTDRGEVARALTALATSYAKASEHKRSRNEFDPYPELNWLRAQVLLRNEIPDAALRLDRCQAAARERFKVSASFWDAISLTEIDLVRHLLQGDLHQSADELRKRFEEHRTELRPSPREFDSVLNEIKFIADVLEKLYPPGPAQAGNTTAVLREIWRQLSGTPMEPSAADRPVPVSQPAPGGAPNSPQTNGLPPGPEPTSAPAKGKRKRRPKKTTSA